MKNTLLLITMMVLLMSCKKEKPEPDPDPNPVADPANLKLELTAWFENEELVAGDEYINISGYRVNVTELKLYLSHIYLLRENGDTVNVSDIAFFDLTPGAEAITFSDFPTGSYTQIGFGIGVPAEMNSPANPDFNIAIYDSNHPLGVNNNMYWAWATGYRFVIFDGKYDTDAESDDPLIDGYSFHTGKDESYRLVNLQGVDVDVVEGQTTTVYLDFSVDRFFYSDTDEIDIAVDNMTHGTNQELSDRLSDNIQQAVAVRE